MSTNDEKGSTPRPGAEPIPISLLNDSAHDLEDAHTCSISGYCYVCEQQHIEGGYIANPDYVPTARRGAGVR